MRRSCATFDDDLTLFQREIPTPPERGAQLQTVRSQLFRRRFLQPNIHFSAFFEIYSRAYRAKKKCTHFSSPEKNTFGGEKGWQILRVKSARIEGG